MENQAHGNSLQYCKQQRIQTTSTVAAAGGLQKLPLYLQESYFVFPLKVTKT